jgi:hypothetical protein
MKTQPINTVMPLTSERLSFHAKIKCDTSVEDVLKPEFWANVCKKLVAHKTHIECDWEDGSRLVVLRVVGVGANYAKVKVLNNYSFISVEIENSTEVEDDFEVKYKTHHHKWSVLRKNDLDNPYVKDQFDTEQDAQDWLKKYLAGEIKQETKIAA